MDIPNELINEIKNYSGGVIYSVSALLFTTRSGRDAYELRPINIVGSTGGRLYHTNINRLIPNFNISHIAENMLRIDDDVYIKANISLHRHQLNLQIPTYSLDEAFTTTVIAKSKTLPHSPRTTIIHYHPDYYAVVRNYIDIIKSQLDNSLLKFIKFELVQVNK